MQDQEVASFDSSKFTHNGMDSTEVAINKLTLETSDQVTQSYSNYSSNNRDLSTPVDICAR